MRIARIFNVYGPRMRPRDGRVVSNFLVQALKGEPLTIYGDGCQTRSFCYVDDEIGGFLALLDSDRTGPLNIGNSGEFTVRELADLVLDVTGSTSEIVYLDLPVDDPRAAPARPDPHAGPSWAGSPRSSCARASCARPRTSAMLGL